MPPREPRSGDYFGEVAADRRLAPTGHSNRCDRSYDIWTTSRSQFNVHLKQPGSAAQAEKWQKLYYRGSDAQGQDITGIDHRTRLRLRPFVKQ